MIDPLPTDIFRTGEVLNNTYEIEGVLGRGGTGEVYRVVNVVTNRTFAAKALNARFSGNEDYVELMKREEEMRNIIHDSVVRYVDCSRTDDGHVILVMDYIAGSSLAEVMIDRQVTEKELLIIGHRIAEGLVAAHAQGIVHRDLSPDNIILRDGEAERATLIDFGIAKDTADGARTIVGNDFAGKYEYAAPEQVDGRAEASSDLYALGATLLAAYRGETPYLGTTPGEIVRRKQGALDTEGVPERLRSLIDTLADPDPAGRPNDAAAAVRLIDGLLDERKSGRGGGERRTSKKDKSTRRKSSMPLLLAGLAVAVLAVVGFFLRDTLFGSPLPVVTPYTLTASKAVAGRTMLMGHAPDEESASSLISAFTAATGAPEAAAEVTLADGVPNAGWVDDVAGLIAVLDGLSKWEVIVSDQVANLTGLAADSTMLDAIRADLQNWQAGSGLSLQQSIQAGPEVLTASALDARLEDLRSCGPLTVSGDQFALGATVPISGNVADASEAARIEAALSGVIGSRQLDVDVSILNSDICAIRDIIPVAQTGDMSIRLSNGFDGSANLTGVFRTGENPVVDILVPATRQDAYLWVMVVDNTGKVFHVLPNINDNELQIENLGVVEGGVRRITVLHPRSILETDPKKLVVEVLSGSYGKSEVVAFLSRTPLFNGRRPRDESTISVKEALTEALSGRDDEIISFVSRIIDARE